LIRVRTFSKLDDQHDVIYNTYAYPSILSNRDSLCSRCRLIDRENGKYSLLWRSASHEDEPESKSFIRTWTFGCYILETNPTGTTFYSYGMVDARGWLPDWFVTQFCPAGIKDLCGNVGKCCRAWQKEEKEEEDRLTREEATSLAPVSLATTTPAMAMARTSSSSPIFVNSREEEDDDDETEDDNEDDNENDGSPASDDDDDNDDNETDEGFDDNDEDLKLELELIRQQRQAQTRTTSTSVLSSSPPSSSVPPSPTKKKPREKIREEMQGFVINQIMGERKVNKAKKKRDKNNKNGVDDGKGGSSAAGSPSITGKKKSLPKIPINIFKKRSKSGAVLDPFDPFDRFDRFDHLAVMSDDDQALGESITRNKLILKKKTLRSRFLPTKAEKVERREAAKRRKDLMAMQQQQQRQQLEWEETGAGSTSIDNKMFKREGRAGRSNSSPIGVLKAKYDMVKNRTMVVVEWLLWGAPASAPAATAVTVTPGAIALMITTRTTA
jgi:hypothetical protein